MFGTIKNYLLAALAIAVGILAAVASWYRASLKSAQLKGVKKAREVEQKDIKATIEGLENENKAVNSDIKPDHFK